eukprot:gene797-439_t
MLAYIYKLLLLRLTATILNIKYESNETHAFHQDVQGFTPVPQKQHRSAGNRCPFLMLSPSLPPSLVVWNNAGAWDREGARVDLDPAQRGRGNRSRTRAVAFLCGTTFFTTFLLFLWLAIGRLPRADAAISESQIELTMEPPPCPSVMTSTSGFQAVLTARVQELYQLMDALKDDVTEMREIACTPQALALVAQEAAQAKASNRRPRALTDMLALSVPRPVMEEWTRKVKRMAFETTRGIASSRVGGVSLYCRNFGDICSAEYVDALEVALCEEVQRIKEVSQRLVASLPLGALDTEENYAIAMQEKIRTVNGCATSSRTEAGKQGTPALVDVEALCRRFAAHPPKESWEEWRLRCTRVAQQKRESKEVTTAPLMSDWITNFLVTIDAPDVLQSWKKMLASRAAPAPSRARTVEKAIMEEVDEGTFREFQSMLQIDGIRYKTEKTIRRDVVALQDAQTLGSQRRWVLKGACMALRGAVGALKWFDRYWIAVLGFLVLCCSFLSGPPMAADVVRCTEAVIRNAQELQREEEGRQGPAGQVAHQRDAAIARPSVNAEQTEALTTTLRILIQTRDAMAESEDAMIVWREGRLAQMLSVVLWLSSTVHLLQFLSFALRDATSVSSLLLGGLGAGTWWGNAVGVLFAIASGGMLALLKTEVQNSLSVCVIFVTGCLLCVVTDTVTAHEDLIIKQTRILEQTCKPPLLLPQTHKPPPLLPHTHKPLLLLPRTCKPPPLLPHTHKPLPLLPQTCKPLLLLPQTCKPLPLLPQTHKPPPLLPHTHKPLPLLPQTCKPPPFLPQTSRQTCLRAAHILKMTNVKEIHQKTQQRSKLNKVKRLLIQCPPTHTRLCPSSSMTQPSANGGLRRIVIYVSLEEGGKGRNRDDATAHAEECRSSSTTTTAAEELVAYLQRAVTSTLPSSLLPAPAVEVKLVHEAAAEGQREGHDEKEQLSAIRAVRRCAEVIHYWELENEEERLGATMTTFACYVVVPRRSRPMGSPGAGEGDAYQSGTLPREAYGEEEEEQEALRALSRGDVTYALHRRQMPVLWLRSYPSASSSIPGSAPARDHWLRPAASALDTSQRSPAHPPRRPRTAQEHFLFSMQSWRESADTAVRRFLRLLAPAESASSPCRETTEEAPLHSSRSLPCTERPRGLLLGLELDELALPAAGWTNETRRLLRALPGALSATLHIPSEEIVLWSASSGYPVRPDVDLLEVRHSSSNNQANGSRAEEQLRDEDSAAVLPPPPSTLKQLAEKLVRLEPASCSRSGRCTVAVREGVHAPHLLPRHPSLPAELMAYQRYQNLHLLRHLYVYRGCCVVLLGEMSGAGIWLSHWLQAGESNQHKKTSPTGRKTLCAELSTMLAAEYRLEHTYLDLPAPRAVVCLGGDTTAASCAVSGAVGDAEAPATISWLHALEAGESNAPQERRTWGHQIFGGAEVALHVLPGFVPGEEASKTAAAVAERFRSSVLPPTGASGEPGERTPHTHHLDVDRHNPTASAAPYLLEMAVIMALSEAKKTTD